MRFKQWLRCLFGKHDWVVVAEDVQGSNKFLLRRCIYCPETRHNIVSVVGMRGNK